MCQCIASKRYTVDIQIKGAKVGYELALHILPILTVLLYYDQWSWRQTESENFTSAEN